MEDRNNQKKTEWKTVSGSGDRDGSFFPGPKEDPEPPVRPFCPHCDSFDVTKTGFEFPYDYICNSCGSEFQLPL